LTPALFCPRRAAQDFRTARLQLKRVEREPGLNTTGMVAWLMTLKTPECPQGRQVRALLPVGHPS
jgi:acetyl-CoA carboxylase / biotin carboxylase 1